MGFAVDLSRGLGSIFCLTHLSWKGSMGKATYKRNIAIPEAFETGEVVGKRQCVKTDLGNVNDYLV